MCIVLAATKQLYEWFSPSVCLSVRPSVTPFSLCSHRCIIMKFSWFITNDRSDVHAKDQDQRSKVKVTEIKPQFSCFRTITPVWIYIWWWNDAHRCCLEEVPYCFSRSSIKFQGHTRQKITTFDQNWVFPDCNSSLNSPMDLKRSMHKAWHNKEGMPNGFSRKVIHQISRSHGLKSWWFESNLSKITRPVAAIKSLRFALFSLGKVQCKLHWSLPTSKLVGTFQPTSLQHLIESTG